jgi:hypothetical protein
MREILPQSVVEVGHMGAAFAGRLVVREFGSCVEATFSSCEAPSFRQRLNEWHKSGGETSLGEPPPPFYGMGGSFPDKPKETDRERAMRRARQRLRFLIKAINADRMLTLTHRDNIEDFAESRKILAKFLAMCRREWSAWRFVGVPEPQQRGAWHWHFALPGWVNVHKLRAFWWRAHGRKVAFSDEGSPILLDGCLTPGNVDIKAPKRSASRRTWDPDRLSGYLSKYLGKTLGDNEALQGIASYVAARGITWKARKLWVFADSYADVVAQVFDALRASRAELPFIWQSPDQRVIWASALCDGTAVAEAEPS